MFAVQKYVSRGARPPPPSPARHPAAACSSPIRRVRSSAHGALLARWRIFVVMMYLCVPIGALFPTWGYKFSPLTGKWFELRSSRKYHGFQAFTRLLRPVADLRAHHGAAVHDHLLSRGQAEVQGQGLHRGGLHARHGGARHRSGRRLHPRLLRRPVPHRAPAAAFTARGSF